MRVPVIDLFAGAGGLSEGFFRSDAVGFDIAVSIEKDAVAYETLLLRSAHRHVARSALTTAADWKQWDGIVASTDWQETFDALEGCGHPLFRDACAAARAEAWNLELGPDSHAAVSAGIRQRLAPFMHEGAVPENIVLTGGPPCQAYSVVGRARNRGIGDYVPEHDHRHFLYKEYLQVIREFRPAAFVMENVKGILSSRVGGKQIFASILADLRRPDRAVGQDCSLHYQLFALTSTGSLLEEIDPHSFIIRAEEHGIPQARHRVVICGIRSDVVDAAGPPGSLARGRAPFMRDVTGDLPALRAEVSRRGKGLVWRDLPALPLLQQALVELENMGPACGHVAARMRAVATTVDSMTDPGSGVERLSPGPGPARRPDRLADWYRDRELHVLTHHVSRSHMPDDLIRYLFVAAYGELMERSPKLQDFPPSLLPDHRNVDREDTAASIFKDRFRVQLGNTCALTVTSHIGKDGHAFIHPDPLQFRSLTVREAARLQTFPDSYVFMGDRTAQYQQVGNAVPPLLARRIADVIGQVLSRAGLAASRDGTGPRAAAAAVTPRSVPEPA